MRKMKEGGNGRSPAPARRAPEPVLSRGTVIRIDRAKGFGFLIDSAGEQRFFHRSAVLDSGFAALKEQQAVEFEPSTDQRGARALKVRPAGTTPRSGSVSPRAHPSPKATKVQGWRSDLSPFRDGTAAPTSAGKAPGTGDRAAGSRQGIRGRGDGTRGRGDAGTRRTSSDL